MIPGVVPLVIHTKLLSVTTAAASTLETREARQRPLTPWKESFTRDP